MLTTGQKIKILRDYDLSYNKIVELLGCPKSLVCYHLADGQREKTRNRNRKRRSKQHPFQKKIEHFCYARNRKSKQTRDVSKDIPYTDKKLLYIKILTFHSNGKSRNTMYEKLTFSVEDVISKFGETTTCYLTGDQIDVYKPRTYHFDHKVPRSKGGTNTIDNLGICTRDANQAKNDMTEDQFIEFCKKVLLHHGYTVNK